MPRERKDFTMNHLCLSDFEQIKTQHNKLYKDICKIFLLYLKKNYLVNYTDVNQIEEKLLERFAINILPELVIFDTCQNKTVLTTKTERDEIRTSGNRFKRYLPRQSIEITDWSCTC